MGLAACSSLMAFIFGPNMPQILLSFISLFSSSQQYNNNSVIIFKYIFCTLESSHHLNYTFGFIINHFIYTCPELVLYYSYIAGSSRHGVFSTSQELVCYHFTISILHPTFKVLLIFPTISFCLWYYYWLGRKDLVLLRVEHGHTFCSWR